MRTNEKRILLANDLSDSSGPAMKIVEQVETCAQSFSRLFDIPIGYISVTAMRDLDVSQPENVISARRAQVEARLSKFQVQPEIIVRFGPPADEIVRVANAEPQVELIVIGTRGRTGFEHIWEGSIAEDVIRHSSRPVVVVGPNVQNNGRLPERPKIVVATDFGESAQMAEQYAVQLAKNLGLEVRFLFCLGDELRSIQETILDTGVAPYDFDLREKQLREQVERDFEKKVEQTKKNGVNVTYEIRRGLAVDELPAASKICDLLITGTRGRNRLLTAFFGSAARSAILSSAVPVMVVPPTIKI